MIFLVSPFKKVLLQVIMMVIFLVGILNFYFSPVLKVHPSSISIEGTLGNFRLCDLSLGGEHYWGWLCDIRNQGAESLIQVHCWSIKCIYMISYLGSVVSCSMTCNKVLFLRLIRCLLSVSVYIQFL